MIRGVLMRAFGLDPEIEPIPRNKLEWRAVHLPHYLLGIVQLSLVVNRLVHELRNEIFLQFTRALRDTEIGRLLDRAPEIWIAYTGPTDEGSHKRAPEDAMDDAGQQGHAADGAARRG